jgi:hypothetical protein
VLVSHDLGTGKESGRMRYAKDTTKVDPFETWKQMRIDRAKAYRPVTYTVFAITFLAFVAVLRRVKSLWVAQCLSQVWIILGSQLTCYYYVFLVLCAPITRLRRDLEVWLFGFAAVSQVAWRSLPFYDDRYAALTMLCLVLTYGMLFSLARKPNARLVGDNTGVNAIMNLDGVWLAALCAILPGIVFAAMGAMKQDVSTVLIGTAIAAFGVALRLAYRSAPAADDSAPQPSA